MIAPGLVAALIGVAATALPGGAQVSSDLPPEAYESGEPSGHMPPVGRCFATSVRAVTTRLIGVPESGTAVLYRDGHAQVSYDRVPPAERSRPGDLMRLCVVSVPHACPAGDLRGVLYRATDQRTGRRWVMFNAEHRCGGG